ncbi:hypothetical protein OVS_03480 [Mycoplasma ovis str. Michigan]|uniref:Uncharacterized protein n=2 Tax=Mycoplasma ovis TaxID=171632 RepID=A0ABM5P288_9MOLU|nr:hypothetical protein OVS_03480 [Mycoplasma ovis str. Michigan]
MLQLGSLFCAGIGFLTPATSIFATSTTRKKSDRTEEKVVVQNASVRRNLALSELKNKGCKLLSNVMTSNSLFNAIWVCKESDEKASFYYLDKEETFDKDTNLKSPKRIFSVNFSEGTKSDESVLSIRLYDQMEDVNLSVASYSRWHYFHNIVPEDHCRLVTPMLGGDLLHCVMADPEGTGEFISYYLDMLA